MFELLLGSSTASEDGNTTEGGAQSEERLSALHT